MALAYTKLPGYNQIFLDYIYNFDKVKDFYGNTYRKKESILQSAKVKEGKYPLKDNFSRGDIVSILSAQNKFFNSGDKAFSNIEILRDKKTFAIVTGQQVGILGGNYYTILKALNTIQLSERLNEDQSEYKFVPVFWLECEDHDFLEVNNVSVLNRQNKVRTIKYFENGEEKEKYVTPVNKIEFDAYILNFRKELEEALMPTEYTEWLMDIIDRSYKEGIAFHTAFARFLNYIIGDRGLIFLDPSDIEIKRILLPVFEKELNTFPSVCERVIDTSVKLEQEYTAQVKPKPVNLFYNNKGGRYLIESRPEDIFALKNTRQRYNKTEIFESLYTNPELFSPNVILRPICQDYLLPTAAYIGGPSEIAYFAQLKSVYEFFEMDMPVIYPRTSATIVENRVNNFLIKYGIQIEEIFDERKIINSIMNKVNEIKVEDIFNNFTDELNAILYVVYNDIRKIDKNIETLMKNKAEKFIETVGQVKRKLIDTQVKQNDEVNEKLKSIIENVYPESQLQERFINITYYLNKYGMNFCGFLFSRLDTEQYNHHLIYLNESVTN